MPNEKSVAQHYTHGALLKSIQVGVEQLGKTIDSVTFHDFAPVDEFHIGGRQATEHLMAQLGLTADAHVLDVGCGLGGPARFVADKYGCRVTGIDVTDEYVKTGQAINEWVGLNGQIALQEGSALALPFAAESFQSAYMIHVGMNIAKKAALFSGVHRVLRDDAKFGVYDVMQISDGDVAYPVPWANDKSLSTLSTPKAYQDALHGAGFEIVTVNDRRDYALDFFEAMRSKSAANGVPPPLGLHVLMAASTPVKVKNMIENLVAGLIAPVEIIARRR
jgi:cyclopropane fatty-acyl-phospholipid synthase-like methyltransferase